jgi:hypothetical protein
MQNFSCYNPNTLAESALTYINTSKVVDLEEYYWNRIVKIDSITNTPGTAARKH